MFIYLNILMCSNWISVYKYDMWILDYIHIIVWMIDRYELYGDWINIKWIDNKIFLSIFSETHETRIQWDDFSMIYIKLDFIYTLSLYNKIFDIINP